MKLSKFCISENKLPYGKYLATYTVHKVLSYYRMLHFIFYLEFYCSLGEYPVQFIVTKIVSSGMMCA